MMVAISSILILVVVSVPFADTDELFKQSDMKKYSFGRCKPFSETQMENLRSCSEEHSLQNYIERMRCKRMKLCMCVAKQEKFLSEDGKQFDEKLFLQRVNNSYNPEDVKSAISKAAESCVKKYDRRTQGKIIMMHCLHPKLSEICSSKPTKGTTLSFLTTMPPTLSTMKGTAVTML